MDKRKLKKLPSLLGRSNSNPSNKNQDENSTQSPKKKDRLTPSKSRPRSPDENMEVSSREGSLVLSRPKSRNLERPSTQLSSSSWKVDNVTTRKRPVGALPELSDAISDESEDDTFLSKSKKTKSLNTPKKSVTKLGSQKTSSKTRPRSSNENMEVSSREGSPVLSRSQGRNVGKTLTSTQLSSSSRNVDNITTRRRSISLSPVCSDAISDDSEDDTFISKSKKNKSLDTSRRSTAKTLEKKRKRVISASSESDSRYSNTQKGKRSESPKKTSGGKSSPEKSIGGNKKSVSRTSLNSSVTDFAPEAVSSDEYESVDAVRGNGTRKSSSQRKVTPLKKKSGGLSVALVRQEGGSEDEDIFADVLPTSSKASQVEKSAKSQTVASSQKGKGRDKSFVGQRRSDESVQNSDRITRSQRHKKSPDGKNVVHHLKAFFKSGGILLSDDGPNLLCENWRTIVGKLTELLKSEEFDKDEIVKQFQDYIDDVNNLQSVLSQTMVNEQEALIEESTESVSRILLNVPALQDEIAMSLLDRLALAIFIEESLDSVPWSGTLLRQFKFLEEIVEPVSLVNKLGDLLESAQPCFQSEIISYLPDIIIDAQHHAVGEVLRKLMDDNSDLIAVILDCISRLTLSADYVEGIRDKTLDLLKGNPLQSTLPAMTRFILGASTTPEAQVRALTVIRAIDMQPLSSTDLDECFTNQVLTVSALKTAFLVSKKLADISLTVIQGVKKDPKPLDLVMLLLIFYSNSMKKKNVKTFIRNRVRSGFYRASLLTGLYYDYKQVARDLQSVAIPVATELLKAGDRVYSEFAIEWFRLLFLSQEDSMHKQQEVLAKIIRLTGVGTETSKNALAILSRLAHKDEEREHLQKHSHHLRTLLEEVDELDLEEVATVSDLLHGLCIGSHSTSDALQTDLDIVLYKQLASCKPVTKCKGVLGALMAIKHSASYPRTRNRAVQLFEQVVKAVRSCSKSRALFYDRMAEVIGTAQHLDDEFLETFTEHFTADLTSLYLVDIKDYDGPFSAQFSLNSEVECPPEVEYGISFGEGKYGSAVSALFRLIKACYLRAGNDDLSAIDALLACPIFMPRDLHEPDAAVLDQVFHCINWFREILSGFVTYTDNKTQKMLLKRLEHLMILQAELSMDLTMAEARYQPPLAYFHYFPSPPFVRIEKKSGKRGNKTVAVNKSQSLSECSVWESGSLLIRKNPAYFRRLDAKIAHLLDFSMVVRSTQNTTNSVTIVQVCFIIQELLGMLENEASQTFMKDLVGLLPKVCAKLDQVTAELQEKNDSQNRECFRLVLSLLTVIFNWKGFHNFANNGLLREALRVIASQSDATNTLLRSCKELVTQSCSYVESLTEVATRIPVAIALVNLFEALIQHSNNHAQQHKQNLAKMAFGFLCLDWPDDKSNGAAYRAAVASLLKIWFNNEPDPLDTVVTLLKWLPREAEKLVKPQDSLATILSINRNTFNSLFKQIFVGLIKGIKMSLATVRRDSERINIWNSVATGVQSTVNICKSMELKANWLIFLQHFSLLLKFFIDSGMPVLEHNLKHHMEEVTGIVKDLQVGTRYLHILCCHTTVTGDVTLAKFVPAAKSTLERLVFSVKGMLVLNNSTEAFWMGNLINKDIKGHTIDLESTEESTTVSVSSEQTEVSEELLTDVSDNSMDMEDETE